MIKVESSEFYFFLWWYRDKLEEEDWDWKNICNRMIDVVQSPWKFEKEMREFKKRVTYE